MYCINVHTLPHNDVDNDGDSDIGGDGDVDS
jgi:hypothetical protein